MTLKLSRFGSDHLAAAAHLLSERHARHVRDQPLLSTRYTDPKHAQLEIAGLWETPGASGSVAFEGEELTGFLLGIPKASSAWGANIWVEAAGHAVVHPDTLRDLYGHAAREWLAQERPAHYALVPATDNELVDTWFHLGFGMQHVHGIRAVSVNDADLRHGAGSGSLTVRRALREDIPALARLDLVVPQHQADSPVFSSAPIPSIEDAQAEWEADMGDPEFTEFVAELGGLVIGFSVGCSLEKSSIHVGLSRPDDAAYLSFAAVLPAYQGVGAGRALGEAVLNWAAHGGYPCVVTDWRVTNLLSSRAWPRLGFVPAFSRLHRYVGY